MSVAWGVAILWAQVLSLPEVEKKLAEMGRFVLHEEDTRAKDSVNRLFIALWKEVLSQPEAFSYPFDSVITVSDLCPPDSAFRVFTWQVIDFKKNEHHYYGLVVRRWRSGKKEPWQVNVIELKEIPEVLEMEDVERRTLSSEEWVGALYYHPRYVTHGVLRYEGEARVPRGRKLVKEKMVYYVLLGWNGYDRKRNFKVVETIFIDPKHPEKVFFGAPVIYSSAVPKMRLILPYSETTALSLNMGWYVKRIGGRRRYTAIIFDHVATSRRANRMYEDPRPFFGADGTYDALEFWKRRRFEGRKGILVYRRNVIPYAPEIEDYDPKVIWRQREEAAQKLHRYGFTP
ncbi:MAG: hypothetical protein N2253_06410 [Bacteroidia bacterium]|nr:hypothetical protein [Bacteroidia bacterium]MCX7764504.1 hypothetical protein [Bacteroidia bacterium]MDW8056966.1 hypothetical protein [Bacteroidia bacterium]